MTQWFRHTFQADRDTLRKSAKIIARHLLSRVCAANDNSLGVVG